MHSGQTKEIGMFLHEWRLHETQSKWQTDSTDSYELIIMEGYCNEAKMPARLVIIHCGQVQIIFSEITQFSDEENHGEKESLPPNITMLN